MLAKLIDLARRGKKMLDEAAPPDDFEEALEGAELLVETLGEIGIDGLKITFCEQSAHLFVEGALFATGTADNWTDAVENLYSRVTDRLFINPVHA